MLYQRRLDLPFLRLIGQTEEIEAIRVLDGFAGQVGLRFGQPLFEIGDRLALALQQAGLDLHHQHVARPGVFNRLGQIPVARLTGSQFVNQGAEMEPRQLCSSLLHKFRLGPGLGHGAHVFEITRRKAFHLREGVAQIVGQPVDDLGAPSLACLPGQDIAADLPVEQHQFAVDRQRRPLLGVMDTVF